jgi:hypothetical protein
MPRFYLYSEFGVLSEAELEAKKDLESAGVGYLMVPETGHQMGLQNPKGFAQRIAEAIGQTAAATGLLAAGPGRPGEPVAVGTVHGSTAI